MKIGDRSPIGNRWCPVSGFGLLPLGPTGGSPSGRRSPVDRPEGGCRGRLRNVAHVPRAAWAT